ncbi:protein-disulfide isomerase [Glaciihabitans tibetensis]|uniref:Protein-disulfide isomerase n=1 Tax=Glaciihabitans tibetensis TaxID=1266600 RepID=A0A2T0VA98_9MICO|nr:thioredoxin domain-containing protein [Glaciihabitans tibetensis]PRY67112.1 protein-disulfide isomerase [Glaciihabitans tibetensis]
MSEVLLTNGSTGDGNLSKSESREAARAKAKAIRDSRKRKDRAGKLFLQGGIIVGALAIITVIVLVLVNTQRPAGPGPLNMLSDGIKIGAGMIALPTAALEAEAEPVPNAIAEDSEVIDIQIYVDYLCPFCKIFEDTNTEQLESWLERGAVTVEVHPISILNSNSMGTQYSTRSANVAACVANFAPDSFWAVNKALFANQPEERTAGLSDDELLEVVSDAGLTPTDAIESCVRDQTFKTWVGDATLRALDGPVPNSEALVKGTPTVVVDGLKYEGAVDDPDAFAQFVIQAAGATFSENSTATPTPTPAP